MKKLLVLFICIASFLPFALQHVSAAEPDTYTESFSELADKYKKYSDDNETKKVTLEEFLTGEESENDADFTSNFSDELSEFWNALPKSVRENLPVNDDDLSHQSDLSGKFGFGFFFEFLKNTLRSIISPLTVTAATVIGAVILSSVMHRIAKASDNCNADVISALICATVCLTVFSSGLLDIEKIKFFFTSVSNLATAILPVMTALLVYSGNVSGSVVNSGSVTVFSTVMEYLFSKVVVPLTVASMTLAIVGCILSENTSFSLSAFLRKFSNFVTLVSMTVFTFVLAVQTSLARSADTVGVKTVKFVIGSFVPIVGGAVSETVNAVDAGLSYIKTTCGTLAIIVIFFMVAPPLISLLASKLIFSLSSSVASVLGCETESKLLSELSSVTDCFSSLIISSAAVFILILSSFAAMNSFFVT